MLYYRQFFCQGKKKGNIGRKIVPQNSNLPYTSMFMTTSLILNVLIIEKAKATAS